MRVYMRVCLFVLSAASALWNATPEFRYVQELGFVYRRSELGCILCFGHEDCFVPEQSRCEYTQEAESALKEDYEYSDSNPTLRAEVDSMLYSLTDIAAADPRYKKCIPHISQYTDCTKENVCLGCTTCACDVAGAWNCTVAQQCSAPPKVQFNHRTLLLALENIRSLTDKADKTVIQRTKRFIWEIQTKPTVPSNEVANENLPRMWNKGTPIPIHGSGRQSIPFPEQKKSNLVKRSIVNTTPKAADVNIISYNEITEWLDYFHPSVGAAVKKINNLKAIDNETTTHGMITTTQSGLSGNSTTTTRTTNPDSNSLAFDEILNSVTIGENYTRRKPSVDINRDYVNYDEDNVAFSQDSDFNDRYNFLLDYFENGTQSPVFIVEQVTEAALQTATDTIIDLLDPAKRNLLHSANRQDMAFVDYMDDFTHNTFDVSNKLEMNAVNIMKREITVDRSVSTTTQQNNDTDNFKALKENVVYPLNNIIDDKLQEISQLQKIKGKLTSFLNKLKGDDIDMFLNNNKTDKGNKTKTFLSIYKLDIAPEVEFTQDVDLDFRRAYLRDSNKEILPKLLVKLKRDVNELLKDIIGIKKFTAKSMLPEHVKFLIKSMKHYFHKYILQNKRQMKTGRHTPKNARRRLNQHYNTNANPITDAITQIIEVVDKDMPTLNALDPLSQKARRIFKRVIKQHYVNEFSVMGLRGHDPHYNLTNDLKNIGLKWQEKTDAIVKSAPSDKLYNLKLLHLILSKDIAKIKDAMALIDFAGSRRMIPVDESEGEQIILKINDDLRNINSRVAFIIKNTISTQHQSKPAPIFKTIKKVGNKSFLKKLKDLLNNSKRDILNLLQKNIPKTEIVRELARKKKDLIARKRLAKYEETMKKWQKSMNIYPVRRKRLASFDVRDRIKNIIPKYLRGKLKPAIASKKPNHTKRYGKV